CGLGIRYAGCVVQSLRSEARAVAGGAGSRGELSGRSACAGRRHAMKRKKTMARMVSRAPSPTLTPWPKLFARVIRHELARCEDAIFHRVHDGVAIGTRLNAQPGAQSENLEMIGMGLSCRRLRTDVTDGAANVLALCGAVFERRIGRHVLRQAAR